MNSLPLITILGPTASGKTNLGVQLAKLIQGEIISADSRQVYRGMDIGSGKDLNEYTLNDGTQIPYHLIDIKDPGYEYNVFEFQKDFLTTFEDIHQKGKIPILCGGTGMYIDSVVKGYRLLDVPRNIELRADLADKENDELIEILKEYRPLHNTTDITDRKRLVNAIEISLFEKENEALKNDFPPINHLIFGINLDRTIVKEKITKRLKQRLEEGMIEEVQGLLDQGFTAEQLKFYGLEYRFVTQYIQGELNYNDMYQKLNTAIHQFAKKQMTWFRRMEKKGTEIIWIDGNKTTEERMNFVMQTILQKSFL
ncbi:tRNA (adenosine(37)-N6)-dimethylallyltransferase MiaA [Sediminitomix flava]|uniref:tRNA dimethylallyltransferase n=1 Tax=Sediminitomix flava TaxID=379075 RepID=A0A315ZWU9_SEDFL|nr:tRNA (adenosine(37)-N6)-dimethylallyltransferase MiaA [Sediminitomix flava]PWJ41807.1 tRNA dimethylallyltransferase [Sediminitomix flava]